MPPFRRHSYSPPMPKPYFSWKEFRRSVLVSPSLETALPLLNTAEGLSRWFIGTCRFYRGDAEPRGPNEPAQSGDGFEWMWLNKPLKLDGAVLEVGSNSIRYTFGAAGHVVFSAREENGRVRVSIEQALDGDSEYNSEDWVNCYVCWSFFLLNLKSVIEHHTDLREREITDDELVNF
jgi:hypothetical protein